MDCAAALDIVRGFADGQFKPGPAVTRAQSFLLRAAGYALHDDPDFYDDPADTGPPRFADVPAGNAHYGNVNAAGEVGIARGFTDGTYRPAATTRRDQMSSFVVRLLTLMNG